MNPNHYTLGYVLDLIQKTAAAAKLPVEVKVLDENPYAKDGTDGLLDVPNWAMDVNGLILCPSIIEQERPVIGGKRMFKFNGFVVDESYTIPGRMYMSNGDPGYPDEQDYRTICEAIHLGQAVECVLLHPMKQQVERYGWAGTFTI